ncbi:DUF2061 domain-containing protein [Tropicimonas sp. IMCC6043]|uniref:DUF2061 domain-containing protein n=1 Tax=Tropicimonas sp. IMCC6043 TaxID=2510645 RepID=UPI00101D81C1|nr:DUF2061 domain-containing protein [Tropicimonas sp. IMCC6043]RYH11538.1 DUF2061 domain-containing protein [Tropicimonas sp. IMCC6043]
MHDPPARSIVKALTWQAMGLVVMTAITWAVTGSVATGGAVALLGAATGTVTYLLHERLWARLGWGRRVEPEPVASGRR